MMLEKFSNPTGYYCRGRSMRFGVELDGLKGIMVGEGGG